MDTKDERIKTFGLDRVFDLKIIRKKFVLIKNYSPEEAFQHSFDILSDENELQKVVLSFTLEQGKYVKSLPLHHSQKVVIDDNKEYRIELCIHPTYDFVIEILSMKTKLLNALNLHN